MNCGNDLINGSNPVTSGTTTSSTIASGAESASQGGFLGGNLTSMLFLLIPLAILIIFWFFSSRSQKKKEKEQAEQRNALKVGDELVTIGGIVGRVVTAKPDDDKVTIEVGGERNRVVIMKWAIQTIIKKENGAKAPEKKEDAAKLNGGVPKQKE